MLRGILGSLFRIWGAAGGDAVLEVTHVEGMLPLRGSGLARKGAACWIAKGRVTRDCLRFSLLGSHSQQHLLCPHQHLLTLGWQFHSCGVTIGADGFVSASTPFLPRNWLSKRSLL